MIGSEIVTTIFPPMIAADVPLIYQIGRARMICAIFGGRWPSEN